jgi:hypothetical protein
MAKQERPVVIVQKRGGHGCIITVILAIIAWPLAILFWVMRALKWLLGLPFRLFRR